MGLFDNIVSPISGALGLGGNTIVGWVGNGGQVQPQPGTPQQPQYQPHPNDGRLGSTPNGYTVQPWRPAPNGDPMSGSRVPPSGIDWKSNPYIVYGGIALVGLVAYKMIKK